MVEETTWKFRDSVDSWKIKMLKRWEPSCWWAPGGCTGLNGSAAALTSDAWVSAKQENIKAWALLLSSQAYLLRSFPELITQWHTQTMQYEISFLETQTKLSSCPKKNLSRSPECNKVWGIKLRGCKQEKYVFNNMNIYMISFSGDLVLFLFKLLMCRTEMMGFPFQDVKHIGLWDQLRDD